MRTFISLLIMYAVALCLSGCDLGDSPKAQLLAAQKSFTAVVESLTEIRRAGKMSDKDYNAVAVLIHSGDDILKKWEASVKSGTPSVNAYKEFDAVLRRLISFKTQYDISDK